MIPELPELAYLRILHGLDLDSVAGFLEHCQEVQVPGGHLLMEEGEEDRGMAMVLDGRLEVFVGEPPHVTVVKQIARGEQVGELSVLGLTNRRSASVRTVEPCRMLVLEPEGLEALRAQANPVVDNIEEEALRELALNLRETDRMLSRLAVGSESDPSDPHGLLDRLARAVGVSDRPWGSPPDLVELLGRSTEFRELPPEVARLLADNLQPLAVAHGEKVIEEGQLGREAFILADGQVGVYRDTAAGRHEQVGVLEPGTIFGHLALIDGSLCTATCVMEKPGWLFRVPKALVQDVVHKHSDVARALRWGFLRALAGQLESANQSLSQLTARTEAVVSQGFAGEQAQADMLQARLTTVGPV